MPKPTARAELNSFVKGFITEASPLNFPSNAARDIENFSLNKDGTIFRRFGIDNEENGELIPISSTVEEIEADTVNSAKWTEVAGVPGKVFIAIQIADNVYIFDSSFSPLSSGLLDVISPFTGIPTNPAYSFSSIDGRLVIVAGATTFAIVTFNTDTETFSVEMASIKTRDIWGVQVPDQQYENDVSFRGGFSPYHLYNLQNQSWGIPRRSEIGDLVDPVEYYATQLNKQPSNSELVWAGLQFQPVAVGQVPFERLYANLYEEVLGANTQVAKGYYIIDALERGVSRMDVFFDNRVKYPELVTPAIVLPQDRTTTGASVVTSFAGRVFFAGFGGEVFDADSRSPNLSNYIFFSKLVRSAGDVVKCYQEGDPTSREFNDVVDTDGGFIKVAGAEGIHSLIDLGPKLIVIARNGVWSITGGSDFGFTATNFRVDRLSSVGSMSPFSVVRDVSSVYYWGVDGIYAVAPNQLGDYEAKNITSETIQSFYDNISTVSKVNVRGVYDSIGKKIKWIIKDGLLFTESSETIELVLDLVLSAFYKNRINNSVLNDIEIFGLFAGDEFVNIVSDDLVFSGVDTVIVLTDDVVIPETTRQPGLQSTRYISITTGEGAVPHLFFSYPYKDTFLDWEDVDGVGEDAKAFLLTGTQTAGDSAVAKQVTYLVMHMFRTENGVDLELVPVNQSSCLGRMQWDFANTINSNKWTPLQQFYRYRIPFLPSGPSDDFDSGFEVVTTKNKMRGRGRAFALYLETEPRKDCKIVGWNLTITGNAKT